MFAYVLLWLYLGEPSKVWTIAWTGEKKSTF